MVGTKRGLLMMQVGDRCADEGLYEAAKLLFVAIDDYPGLALCLIKLKDYQGAADAAKKSGAIKSYKEVSSATLLHHGRCSLARVCVFRCALRVWTRKSSKSRNNAACLSLWKPTSWKTSCTTTK